MANIVVICGINTSTLPKCGSKDLEELMKKVKTGDEAARTQFITYNMRLVLSIVQRFNVNKNNIDDIFQVGIIGLMKAIDNFNIDLGVKFSTYAVPMIIGEIRRFLRDNNSLKISRSLRDIAYLALQAKEKLNRNGAVEPSVEMISNEIHVPIKDVACALEAISEPISLYETVYHDDDDSALIMDQLKDTTTEDAWVEQRMLKDALENIGERERQILFLRYFCGKTQIEISNEIGISQAQVSRLEKSAISQIRNITA